MRVVVVGNGIVALTAALRLSERGAEVCIVGDPARRGSATLAAAAMLSAFAIRRNHMLTLGTGIWAASGVCV